MEPSLHSSVDGCWVLQSAALPIGLPANITRFDPVLVDVPDLLQHPESAIFKGPVAAPHSRSLYGVP